MQTFVELIWFTLLKKLMHDCWSLKIICVLCTLINGILEPKFHISGHNFFYFADIRDKLHHKISPNSINNLLHDSWSLSIICFHSKLKNVISHFGHNFLFQNGQRCQNKFCPNLNVSALSFQFEFIGGYERMHKAWSSIEEMPYCFSMSSVKFQGHAGQKIADFTRMFLDCNSSLNSQMATEWCTKLDIA